MSCPVACPLWWLPGTPSAQPLGKAEAFKLLPQARKERGEGYTEAGLLSTFCVSQGR